MTIEITVKKEYENNSPKSYIKKHFDIPYWKIPKLLKEKRITINGKKIKKETLLKEGDIIKVWLPEINLIEKTTPIKEIKDLKIDLIYENENFLILNKKSGIVVQGAQETDQSISLHLAYLKNKNKDNSDFNYFHVHRLDKETSGVLVIAKNYITLKKLNKIFFEREVKKKYLCLCIGKFKNKNGKIENYLKKTNNNNSSQKMLLSNKNEEYSKKAITIYSVIQEYELENEQFSLVEVEIKTGVTHQIRFHMKQLGNPILGDKMYGNNYVNKKFEKYINRQFLHAKEINFEYENEKYSFEAKLTEDLNIFLKKLNII